MDLMCIYNHSPIIFQNMICFFQGKKIQKNRYGKYFWNKLSEYESRNNWSYAQLCEYRDKKIKDTVRYCYENIPFYRNLFYKEGIDPLSIRRLDDLKTIPIIDKQVVKENYYSFIANGIKRKKVITSHTSGTTGEGFVFKTTQEAICEQWAVWWRYRRKLGVSFDTECALFGGRSVVPNYKETPPFSRHNKPCKQEYFSTYHLKENNMWWYLQELNRHRFEWIHGYPSAISLLADYMIDTGKRLDYNVKYITTGAENLLESQKNKIQQAFGVRPYTHYGMSEGVANFSENQKGEMYVDEDFSAVEFINGEIIGTGFSNPIMPLLRYKMHDNATYVETKCGRKIETLDGRQEDYICLKDGTKIGRLDHIFKDLVNIKEAQIHQVSRENLIINVVKGRNYVRLDEEKLLYEAKSRIKDINIKINYVEQIPKTASGKLRFVISDVK